MDTLTEKTLETAFYESVEVFKNKNDLASCIARYTADHSHLDMERFHFHYSGIHTATHLVN